MKEGTLFRMYNDVFNVIYSQFHNNLHLYAHDQNIFYVHLANKDLMTLSWEAEIEGFAYEFNSLKWSNSLQF